MEPTTKTPADFADLALIYRDTCNGRLIAPGLVKNALEELAHLRSLKAGFDAAAAKHAAIQADAEKLAADAAAEPAQ